MNPSPKHPGIFTPLLMISIGLTILLVSVTACLFISPWDFINTGKDNSACVLISVGGLLSFIIFTLFSSILIYRLNKTGAPVKHAAWLLVASVVSVPMVISLAYMFSHMFRDYEKAYISTLICITVYNLCIARGLTRLVEYAPRMLPAFKVFILAIMVLFIWCMVIALIDPSGHYNYYAQHPLIRREFGDFSTVKLIGGFVIGLITITFIVLWVKNIGTYRQLSYSSENGEEHSKSLEQNQHHPTPAQSLNVDYFLQLQQWAAGLSMEELKYVISNPAQYQPEAVELCIRELLKRI